MRVFLVGYCLLLLVTTGGPGVSSIQLFVYISLTVGFLVAYICQIGGFTFRSRLEVRIILKTM